MKAGWAYGIAGHGGGADSARDYDHSGSDLNDLVRAAQCSQQPDIQRLYSRFSPLIKRLIRRYRHLPVAEELPGEIYLEFVRLTSQFDWARGIPFPSYIKRMLEFRVQTIVRRDYRNRRREVPLALGDSLSQSESGRSESNGHRSDADLPESRGDEIMDSLLTKDLVRRVKTILSPRQAEVFIRHALHEEDYSKIAAVLDSTPAATRFLYHCARRTLQKRLEYVRN